MKKTGMLLLLMVTATLAVAQQSTTAITPDASGIVNTSVNVPFVRFQTPTAADIYCAGFLTKDRVPDANYVNGGLQTPTSTKFETGELVYLAGTGYQAGQLYSIVREMRDANQYEVYPGERKVLAAAGRPYGEIGRVRVVDTRSHSAIAQVEFSCDPINPGDVAVPFVEKPLVAFHVPGHFDRFAPANGKLSGRIVLGKDFDSVLGTGMKLYMNMGSNQGVKVGDYFRVVRSYTATLRDPVAASCVLTRQPCAIRWTRSPSKPRRQKTRRCVRRPLRPIVSQKPKGRTFMWAICRGAPWVKWWF